MMLAAAWPRMVFCQWVDGIIVGFGGSEPMAVG